MKTTFRKDLKAAFLLANGFHDDALLHLKSVLEEIGVQLHVISPEDQTIKSGETLFSELEPKHGTGLLIEEFDSPEKMLISDYHIVIIPGGPFSSFKLMTNPWIIKLLDNYYQKGGVIAAMNHGTRILLEMQQIRGKMLTSPTNFKDDFIEKENTWLQSHVVDHENLITCQKNDYIQEFADKIKHLLQIKEAQASFARKVNKIEDK
ncbi:MAG: hypothetical protein GVY19_02420 [Bacteroidetes bacterium]|jgi:protease I|nr:hypothetical protein [Bacteroidota bacterium]